MSEKLERMLRIALMNQIEIMTALEELLGPEPQSENDLASRAEIRINLGDAIEETIQSLKDLKEQEPGRGDDLAGRA